jgi:hypothetical protein
MRRIVVALLGAVLLVAAGCGGATCQRTYQAAPGPHAPFLWEVRAADDDGGGRLILYGTYHAAGEADVVGDAWRELDAAQVFVSEMDASTLDPASVRLPRGQSLMKLISADDFYELQRILGATAEELNGLKPWVAMVMLAGRAFSFPEVGIDEALTARARRRGLELVFLESAAEQVAALDASVGPEALHQAIEDFPRMRCVLEDNVAAWRAGDESVLGGFDPQAETVLLDERNARWMPKLEALLGSGRRGFVAVGVGHLAGENGIAAQLAARGYAVSRFPAR